MAKWGEGDPRWIVEERADATNVNNWHWTEKDATDWSKAKLKEELLDITVQDPTTGAKFKVTEVSQINGEASVNNRKSKIILFYEWDIKLAWEVSGVGEQKTEVDNGITQGTICIPNLSDENEAESVDVLVYLDEEHKSSEQAKKWVIEHVPAQIRIKMAEYVRLLKEQFASNLILPTDKKGNQLQGQGTKQSATDNVEDIKKVSLSSTGNRSSTTGVAESKVVTKTIKLKEIFQTSVSELYSALTTPEKVQAFTRDGGCVFSGVVGDEFYLFNRNITGHIVELEENCKIVMKWRATNWSQGHYSEVTMRMKDLGGDGVQLSLEQARVPANDYDRTLEGWKRYYFDPMRITFGFGTKLFS